MKRILVFISIVISLAVTFYLLPHEKSDAIKIGLVVPVQNVALDDIVDGFTKELKASLPGSALDIRVQNAAGDINLQKSMINKFINDRVDLIVPVGKAATLMALNMVPKEQNILFLAAFIEPESQISLQHPKLMGVIDEIPPLVQINFMRAVMPELKKVALVYVSSDKVFDDVKEFSEKAATFGITVQKLMVQNLAELYTVASRIDADNQAIFTLKDVMVASGINALVQQANALKIPLITSDEGTIRSGGAFAVGVTEADIGRQGARIAARYIGKQDFDRIQYLNKISVFVNSSACERQNVDVTAVKHAARLLNLSVIEG